MKQYEVASVIITRLLWVLWHLISASH